MADALPERKWTEAELRAEIDKELSAKRPERDRGTRLTRKEIDYVIATSEARLKRGFYAERYSAESIRDAMQVIHDLAITARDGMREATS
jgi:hypothetical protein